MHIQVQQTKEHIQYIKIYASHEIWIWSHMPHKGFKTFTCYVICTFGPSAGHWETVVRGRTTREQERRKTSATYKHNKHKQRQSGDVPTVKAVSIDYSAWSRGKAGKTSGNDWKGQKAKLTNKRKWLNNVLQHRSRATLLISSDRLELVWTRTIKQKWIKLSYSNKTSISDLPYS